MVHHKKPDLHDAYEWKKDVYVKIKQGDKLSSRATKAKWIRHSAQSDGHCIYWPGAQKVSVERNIIFDTEERLKLSPILPSEDQKVSITKRAQSVPQKPFQAPPMPAGNLLSQPSREGWIEEIDESTPEQDFEDLQPSQGSTGSPNEPIPLRRSEKIRLQQDKTIPTGPVTRYQARRDTSGDTITLAYEIDGDDLPEHSGINPNERNQESNHKYFAISTEPIDENQYDAAFIGKDLIKPKSTNEALQNPIWKKSMDNEYNALIDKQTWEVVYLLPMLILLVVVGPMSVNVIKREKLDQNHVL